MPLHFPIGPAIRTALESEGRTFAFSPTQTFAISAIVLKVDGVRREEWTDDVELSQALFQRFPRGIVPSPNDASALAAVETSYKVLDDTKPSRTVRCMSCIVSPGLVPCTACGGEGAITVADTSSTCIACGGSGKITCSVCDGERQAVACTVRYVNDRPVRIRQLLVPQVHDTLRPALTAAIDPDAVWSEELRFDPTPSLVTSAYRGASAVRAEDNFHGHYFGAARDAAIAARDAAVTGLAGQRTAFYAIPIVWLVRESGGIGIFDQHAAYFFDPTGFVREVLGRRPDSPF